MVNIPYSWVGNREDVVQFFSILEKNRKRELHKKGERYSRKPTGYDALELRFPKLQPQEVQLATPQAKAGSSPGNGSVTRIPMCIPTTRSRPHAVGRGLHEVLVPCHTRPKGPAVGLLS